MLSFEQYEREHHIDLTAMPLDALLRERKLAALRELLDKEHDDWLYERIQRLDAAIRRAERGARG